MSDDPIREETTTPPAERAEGAETEPAQTPYPDGQPEPAEGGEFEPAPTQEGPPDHDESQQDSEE